MNGPRSRSRTLGTTTLALAAGVALAYAAAAIAADAPVTAQAKLADAQGKSVGTVEIRDTPNGVIVRARFTGLPPGEHAFHVHAVGKCEPPFESAGPHFDPKSHQHGFAVEGGWHAGDLPNVTIGADGTATVEVLSTGLTVSTGDTKLLDDDGAALIVHEGVDDYTSQPAGNAGKRIACGVVQKGPVAKN